MYIQRLLTESLALLSSLGYLLSFPIYLVCYYLSALQKSIWLGLISIPLVQKLTSPRFGGNPFSRAGRLFFNQTNVNMFFGGALAGLALLLFAYGIQLRQFDGSYYVVLGDTTSISSVSASEQFPENSTSPKIGDVGNPSEVLESAMPLITQASEIPDPVIPKPYVAVKPFVNKVYTSQAVISAPVAYNYNEGTFSSPLHYNSIKMISTYFRPGHPGVDLASSLGTPLYPVKDGVVESIGSTIWAYGNVVYINHGNNIESLYAHMSRINVTVGQQVTADTVIGAVGSTGNSTGPHVHLEIHRNNVPMNPFSFIPNFFAF